ncbi:tetrahydrobiopterin biosynthesis enzymes-like protein [Aspergillus udagawae]|nr:tetrahydrobiopterin biosynthesis enzymes-like protein [Aspergillus udagawae]
MGECRTIIQIPPAPELVDHICLRSVQLPLPSGPDAWHRSGRKQPCAMSLKLSWSSVSASAQEDEVALSLDYGKLYQRIEELVQEWPNLQEGLENQIPVVNLHGQPVHGSLHIERGQDMSLLAEKIASLALAYLHERSLVLNDIRPGTVQQSFGQCEVRLYLPKALLRAEGGLLYRSLHALGYNHAHAVAAVVIEDGFRIQYIRCHCIIGVNAHERLEKQAVAVFLEIKGRGNDHWREKFLNTYQEMTRVVAEEVYKTTFKSVEALVVFIARIVTVDFGNELVTVRAEKPNALAFAEGTGVEITRSREFFG